MHAIEKVSTEKAKQFVCDCAMMKVTLSGMSITVNVETERASPRHQFIFSDS